MKKAYLPSQIVLLLVCLLTGSGQCWTLSDSERLVRKMEETYAGVHDYQSQLEIRARGRDGSFTTRKILYTFKKPEWIRLDFESPHRGMIMVFPDPNRKVLIRGSGWASFLKLRLAPDSFLLRVYSGQQIHQTDLGLLIRNISHSLTDQRRGEVEVAEDADPIRIRVLADNHFREGIVTWYEFLIDRKLWLPVGVEESRPNGTLERTVTFRNLRVNIGVSDRLFHLEGD